MKLDATILRREVPTIDLRRIESESPLAYHKRLVYGKLVDKTLADCDYSELAELIYGQPYSSDVARRMMYGSRKTLELLDDERTQQVSDSSLLSELELKRVEIQQERQRFFDQRREFNRLLAAEGRKEHIYESLTAAADKLMESIGCVFEDNHFDHVHFDDTEAVLVFSDWHYGMETSNVFNKYNTEICKTRVINTVNAAIHRISLHHCRKLHVVVLGDLMHGAIHTSARVASEELACDQLMQASEILAQAILKLSQYVEETAVYVTYGNHARTVQNKHDSIHRDNMERLVPWWLTQRMQAYDNITIMPEPENEFLFINACGHDLCASHGDLDTARCSPRLLTTVFQKKYGKDIEYILLGDKHHRESFNELGVTATVCGSLCGTDDYANDKRLYSHPEQLLLIVDPEYGVDAEYRLKCDVT